MQYLGGKYRVAGVISSYINEMKPERYFEPFCGACWVGLTVEAPHRQFSDINPYLIAMWKAVQKGWVPPDMVSEDEYREAKAGRVPDHVRGFIGFGCSWGGKFFGGYARSMNGNGSPRNYAKNMKQSLLATLPYLDKVAFGCCDYTYLEKLRLTEQDVVYMDPPYANTTKFKETDNLDIMHFWNVCRLLSARCHVLVSSYVAPPDFKVVIEVPTKLDIGGLRTDRMERVFVYDNDRP